MTTYFPPKKNTAFVTHVSLVSQTTTNVFVNGATLASGDVKVRTDDGALTNLATLPTTAGKTIKVSLNTTEMNGDVVSVVFSDAAGSEWQDLLLSLHTVARQHDDLAYPNTSGRGIDVDASGGVEVGSFQSGAITSTAVAASAANEVADAVLVRDTDNVENSAPVHSLYTAVAKLVHRVRDNAGTLEIYRTNATTVHASQAVTTDSAGLPIDELGGAT